MNYYEVFIPSLSRAGGIKTHQYFDNPYIVVPEYQQTEYQKYYKNVLVVPKDVKGITATRNWIIDYCKRNKIKRHIQIDDDIEYFYYTEKSKSIKTIKKNEIDNFITKSFILTEEWGYKIWGWRMATDNKFYREYSPFSTLTVIGANIMGIIDNELYFDVGLPIKEDYDYSLQHINKYRGVIKINKYGVKAVHLRQEGGCSIYRTKRMELEVLSKMQRKWGSKVVRKSNNENIMTVIIPIKGI